MLIWHEICLFSFRITEDPSVLSVVPPVTTPKPLDLPPPSLPPATVAGVGVSSAVGVAQTYSHQSLEQQQQQPSQSTGGVVADVGAVASRMDTVETKEAPLDGPPGLTRPASITAHDSAPAPDPIPHSTSSQPPQTHTLPLPVSASSGTSSSSSSSSVAKTLGLGDVVTSSGGKVPLQRPPEPIEMPRQQTQLQNSHVSSAIIFQIDGCVATGQNGFSIKWP